MVELTEDDVNIYIKITRRTGVDLERVYNKNYFFSLGIDIVEDEEKLNKKKGGKNDIDVDTLDKSEKAIDNTASAISKKVEMASELLSENMNFNAPIEFVIAKSEKESNFQNLTSYLENLKTRSDLNPLTTFSGTGVDYIILENITNDLCSCLDYIKTYGMQLVEKKKEMIYIINGRFLFLTEDLAMFDEEKITEEENILKLLSDICGISYSRGEDHFKSLIYGTLLYSKLKRRIVA